MQWVITMVYAPLSFRDHKLFVYHDHTLFVLWSHIMCASWSQTNYLLWSEIMYVSRSCPKSGNACVSNRDTHLCLLHNSSPVHLITTSEVRRSGRITDGMRSGWTTLRDSVLSSPTPAPTLLKWLFRELRGFGLTASASVSDVSALACTIEIWPGL